MGRPQLVDSLQDLSQAGNDQTELELGDLNETLLVLLDIYPGVVSLRPGPTRQLVLEPRDELDHPLHGFLCCHSGEEESKINHLEKNIISVGIMINDARKYYKIR